MQFKTILLIFTFLCSIIAAGCGDAGSNVSNAKTNAVNANITNTNSALETTKKTEAPTTNNAPTLTPVVLAYYDALKKKDDAALRNLLSKDFLKYVESEMKEDKIASLAEYMAESNTDKPVEVRNEKIDGNKGYAEIRGGAYANWTPFDFINENGLWKFTGGSADLDAVK